MSNRLRNIFKNKDPDTKRQYYKNIEYPEIPVTPQYIYIISKSTDRLDLLAHDYYNDSHLWWVISKANPDKIQRDSMFLKVGLQIRIPTNINEIYQKFEKLNQ